MSYYDRLHFWVEDAHGNFLTKDLVGLEPAVVRNLSGASKIQMKLHFKDPSVQMPGGGPIQFKPWGTWIHAMKDLPDGTERCIASCLVQPSQVDAQTGILSLEAAGFSAYPKGLPWLMNWNPIAVDPFEIVEVIWDHLQSYPKDSQDLANGNLGVTVYPTTSGTQMLPGFGFDQENLVQDFFAIFIREVDQKDCGEYISKLARDIPFDYVEETVFSTDRKKLEKKLHLGYPYLGVDQSDLIFRPNENVIQATQKAEVEIQWASGFTFKGWFPQKQYSASFTNADPDRYRRLVKEDDIHLDSNERAAAWSHRKLTRRQFPNYFETIVIDPYHTNAPWHEFDVGDFVRVQGPLAWHGNIDQVHKIMAIAHDGSKGTMQLNLMAEGAFNYDPIQYQARP